MCAVTAVVQIMFLVLGIHTCTCRRAHYPIITLGHPNHHTMSNVTRNTHGAK